MTTDAEIQAAADGVRPYLRPGFCAAYATAGRLVGYRSLARALCGLEIPAESIKAVKRVAASGGSFAAALKDVLRAVPRRYTLPVLAGVLVQPDGDGLRLTGCDLQTAVSVRAPGSIDTAAVILHPRDLLAFVGRAVPAITISGRQATVSISGATCVLACVDHEEYPPIPAVDTEWTRYDVPNLVARMHWAAVAAATDDSRPALACVYVQPETVVAADGWRLRVSGKTSIEPGLLVPAWAIRHLRDVSSYAVNPARTQMVFGDGGRTVTVQLQAGSFPAYVQLIPGERTWTAVVDGTAMRDALDKLPKAPSDIVRLRGSDGGITMSARVEEGSSADVTVPAEIAGEPKIAFNSRFLRDALDLGGQVEIRGQSPILPAVFVTDSGIEVVMPMFVQR